MAIKAKNPGIYATFVAQMDKAARHNRQGSFRTKEQYYEAENGSAGSWPTTTTCKSWPTSAANTEDFTAITWYAGLRIHKCFRIDTATAEQALRKTPSPSRAREGRSARYPSTRAFGRS